MSVDGVGERKALVYVVAGNHRQYLAWCKKNKKNPYREARYIHSPEQLLGLRGIEVVCTGTWVTDSKVDLESIDLARGGAGNKVGTDDLPQE